MKSKVQRKNLKSNAKFYKQEKGITLIALIVTIVIMLILAGVTIKLAIDDNGVIDNAKEAKDQYEQAQADEDSGLNDLSSEMRKYLDANKGNGGGGTGSDTKVPEAATAETAPYFPDNTFTKKEGTIDKGLVIQDSVGNEYVWVVVPKTLYDNTSYNSNGAKKPKSSEDYSNIEYCLQQYTNVYRNGTRYSDTWVADTNNEGWFADKTEYNTAKNKMLKSVYENGGFYVGRYEAGIATTGTNRKSESTTNSNGKYDIEGMPTPITQANAYPYNYVTRTQAQKLAEKVNSGNKTSSLMFGVQWDLVLAFMAKDTTKITDTSILTSNSTTIGNYSDNLWTIKNAKAKYSSDDGDTFTACPNPYKKESSSSIMLTTGADSSFSVQNIYDIAGNVFEWTLEKTSGSDFPYASRGGNYYFSGSDYPASSRIGYGRIDSNRFVGFRVSLY